MDQGTAPPPRTCWCCIEQVRDEAVIMKDEAIADQRTEDDCGTNKKLRQLEVTGDDRRCARRCWVSRRGSSEGGGAPRIALPAGVEVEDALGIWPRGEDLWAK